MKERGPEPLSEVLSRVFTARGWGRKSERLKLEAAWADAAGPGIAPKTRVGGVKRGVLEVEVAPGALLQELASFHKRRLLEKLQMSLPGMRLKDLKFRAGMI